MEQRNPEVMELLKVSGITGTTQGPSTPEAHMLNHSISAVGSEATRTLE